MVCDRCFAPGVSELPFGGCLHIKRRLSTPPALAQYACARQDHRRRRSSGSGSASCAGAGRNESTVASIAAPSGRWGITTNIWLSLCIIRLRCLEVRLHGRGRLCAPETLPVSEAVAPPAALETPHPPPTHTYCHCDTHCHWFAAEGRELSAQRRPPTGIIAAPPCSSWNTLDHQLVYC
jgi:hypothetical protein